MFSGIRKYSDLFTFRNVLTDQKLLRVAVSLRLVARFRLFALIILEMCLEHGVYLWQVELIRHSLFRESHSVVRIGQKKAPKFKEVSVFPGAQWHQ